MKIYLVPENPSRSCTAVTSVGGSVPAATAQPSIFICFWSSSMLACRWHWAWPRSFQLDKGLTEGVDAEPSGAEERPLAEWATTFLKVEWWTTFGNSIVKYFPFIYLFSWLFLSVHRLHLAVLLGVWGRQVYDFNKSKIFFFSEERWILFYCWS